MFKKRCPICGAKNSKERTACIECGAPLALEQVGGHGRKSPAVEMQRSPEYAYPAETTTKPTQETQSSIEPAYASQPATKPTPEKHSGVLTTIKKALGDKSADRLYDHLLSLGIQVDTPYGHPLQKVRTVKGSFWSGYKADSLGFIQVTGKNIAYINIIKEVHGSGQSQFEFDYLEYMVPIREIPSCLCRATLSIKKRGLLRRKVVDIEWHGGTLADKLNDDSTLNQDLLMVYQLERPIGITVTPEPIYRCIRIETDLYLPSGSLFDCLCRVAQLSAEHVTEIKDEPETILFETKTDNIQDSTDKEIVDCQVTDRYVYIGLREPLRIDWYLVQDCNVTMPTSELVIGSLSAIELWYLDEPGNRRKAEFKMQHYDAACLANELRHSYPSDISR